MKTFTECLAEEMAQLSEIEQAYATVLGATNAKRYIARHAKKQDVEQRYLDLAGTIYNDIVDEFGIFSGIMQAALQYRNVKLESLGYVWSSDTEEYELPAVEIVQRSERCIVATGDSYQWSHTYAALESHRDTLAAQYHRNPFDDTLNLTAELARVDRLANQAKEAIFTADQFGRMGLELFASEAETLRRAIAA